MRIGGHDEINNGRYFWQRRAALGALLNKRENYGQVADLT